MKKEWNKNNIIKVLLWTLAYAVLSILVMELGSIHPVFSSCTRWCPPSSCRSRT
ncbi:MAG: hypothetical protein II639_03255 [Clostridia bacterium]|nr:hypothetical protein [Clostridia bacterium]